jgi:tetratricopeptide (TPR) repeat protein
MADRYTYLPSLGPFLVAGLGAAWLWERTYAMKRLGPFIKMLSSIAAVAVLGFLSVATIQQSGVWKDSLTLWTYVITKDPSVSFAYNNRGLTYDEMGRFYAAIADFDKAIELAPYNHQAYTNRGMLFGKTGRFDKAIEDFKKAIALNPSHPAAYNNLGIAYAKTGLTDEAIEQFTRAILIDHNQAMAYYNRGLLYSRTGEKDRAASDYRKACDLGNNDACSELQQ